MLHLEPKSIPKIWGRDDVAGSYGVDPANNERVGEIWFQSRPEAPLLIKYLFTSERLSIQVHPDQESAAVLGLNRGKDEAWIVLEADPGAVIGVGLKETVDETALRSAALDGSIEDMMLWVNVKAGDAFYSPAGTVHALGGGLKLIEVQQNVDATYRLYDYGRAREIQIDEAVALAKPNAKAAALRGRSIAPGRDLMTQSPAFTIEQWSAPIRGHVDPIQVKPVWLIPFTKGVLLDGHEVSPSSAWMATEPFHVQLHDRARLLVAYVGDSAGLQVSTRRNDELSRASRKDA